MTQETRKRLGKHWKMLDAAGQKNHIGYKQYYEEFKKEIDAELKQES